MSRHTRLLGQDPVIGAVLARPRENGGTLALRLCQHVLAVRVASEGVILKEDMQLHGDSMVVKDLGS